MSLRLLTETLAGTKAAGRAALVSYLPAGFPTVDGGIAALRATLDAGADIVEVGLPHSDPVLDGPVIQTADDRALRGGVRIADVLRTVRDVHAATGKPVLVMSYWNPVSRYGAERFARELADAGGSGCVLPDLPVAESAPWRRHAEEHDLATVFVVAPSSTDRQLADTAAAGTGFVYASALMGVTGKRTSVDEAAAVLTRRLRAVTELPVCVGMGVADGEQAAEVAGFADGVIVGSALVETLLATDDEAMGRAGLERLTTQLAAGVRTRTA
ncbi:tryptophan synthase subunit alpha [Amycolatopsis sp. Hca4]|uniref:tryptophan synthase subunit alpha n=1 Tax=Amycolatopsis sp. Hca4 TaxID=2742131 RepID=UPI0015911B0E|nr:tryptophan synthase subunit alpha [Amycolatopsis sp. Hca4]QKV73681.1 tryptophan synthase subunit alpha [Amycolatopsis sp. Hca4]